MKLLLLVDMTLTGNFRISISLQPSLSSQRFPDPPEYRVVRSIRFRVQRSKGDLNNSWFHLPRVVQFKAHGCLDPVGLSSFQTRHAEVSLEHLSVPSVKPMSRPLVVVLVVGCRRQSNACHAEKTQHQGIRQQRLERDTHLAGTEQNVCFLSRQSSAWEVDGWT